MNRRFIARAGRVALSCALMAGPYAAAALARAEEAAPGTADATASGTAQGAAPAIGMGVKDLPPAPSFGAEGLKVAGILCLMLAFIFAGFWLLKRYGHRAGLGLLSKNQMKLEGQLSLGPKKTVVVVRFLNKRLVLGVTDSNINLLTEMDAGHDAAQTDKDFNASLEEARTSDHSS